MTLHCYDTAYQLSPVISTVVFLIHLQFSRLKKVSTIYLLSKEHQAKKGKKKKLLTLLTFSFLSLKEKKGRGGGLKNLSSIRRMLLDKGQQRSNSAITKRITLTNDLPCTEKSPGFERDLPNSLNHDDPC